MENARIDPGTEFRGNFENTLKDREVKVTRTLPRRHTHNSQEERWHRTLEEGVRAALLQAGAPT